jgi:hypothetical protein
MGKQAKNASVLARLVRLELGAYVDVDEVWIWRGRISGWQATCVGKPLTIAGFQYMADKIVERLREQYDLAES